MNQNIDTILLKSKKLIKDGNSKLANDLLQSVKQKYPNNIRIKNMLLQLDFKKFHIKSAHHYNQLLHYYNKKDFKSALIYGESSILEFPDDANINNIYGLIQTKFKNYNYATKLFKNAINLKSDFSLPYYNLGNVYIKTDDLQNAINYFKKAINIDAKNYLFFEGLGRAYYLTNEYELSKQNLLQSLSLNKNNPNIYNTLGNLYIKLAEFDLAENHFKKSIMINPYNKDAYYNLGNLYKEKNWLDKSIDLYKKSIELDPKFLRAYLNLSSVLISIGEYKISLSVLKKAMDIDPSYPNIYMNIAINYYELGEYSKAIEFNNYLLDFEPSNKNALFNLSLILSKNCPENIDEKLTKNILNILETEGICRPNFIIKPILISTFKNGFFENVKISQLSQISKCEDILSGLIKQKILIKFMETTPIPFLFFENLMTNLRKSILINITKFKNRENLITFQISLAQYCFINEFIFYISEQENKQIKKIQDILIQTDPKDYYNSELLLCLASYYRIDNFKWLERDKICPKIKSSFIKYIEDSEQENLIIKDIPSLNSISDNTSKIVKKIYEENPYPRWIKTLCLEKPSTISQLVFDLNLQVKKTVFENSPEILIAGCGTGQHAIMTSSRFLKSNVLAIDLSFKSLSYAIRKTNELGLKNIKYMQADISEKLNLKTKFDIIECIGVLHHLENPLKGWENLLSLLKDDGLMKVGLYSKIGRQNLTKVKNFISDNKVTNAIKFRNELLQTDNEFISDLQNQDEFYSTSQFKDLLFHPKEHCFTISQIKKLLKSLNLKFCGFENPKFSTKSDYKNNLISLEQWENIEKNNPNLFSGMYQFWVQKL